MDRASRGKVIRLPLLIDTAQSRSARVRGAVIRTAHAHAPGRLQQGTGLALVRFRIRSASPSAPRPSRFKPVSRARPALTRLRPLRKSRIQRWVRWLEGNTALLIAFALGVATASILRFIG